jgi:hypothetical protein
MAYILSEIARCNAQIRAAEAAVKKRDELRQKLVRLAARYAENAAVAEKIRQLKAVK